MVPPRSSDLDEPDDSWRWWEEFGPEPDPPRPGGAELEQRELTRA